MNLDTILKAARSLGPALNALPAIRAIIDHAVKALSETDQAKAKEQLALIRNRSDEMHKEVQDKLGD